MSQTLIVLSHEPERRHQGISGANAMARTLSRWLEAPVPPSVAMAVDCSRLVSQILIDLSSEPLARMCGRRGLKVTL